MKQKLALLAALFCSFCASAQPVAALYGFYREKLPGTVTAGSRLGYLQKEYLIYLKGSGTIKPKIAWINGEPYTVKLVKVKTPVWDTISMVPGSRKLLVGASKQPVYRLILSHYKAGGKPPASLAGKAVIVQYLYNGKLYTKTSSQPERLEPESAL